MMTSYPFTLIGGGLIGTVTGLALAQNGDGQILLLDGKPPPTKNFTNALDTRTIALNYASVNYLDQLGLWSSLEKHACPIEQVHISEAGVFGHCELSTREVGYPALGYVIEIGTLYETCLAAVKKQTQITYITNTQVEKLQPHENHSWGIFYRHEAQEKQTYTDWLFLADGTHSKLREQCGIHSQMYDYEQDAIVAVARTSLPHHNHAYERFSVEHTLAILPLTDNRVGTVLTVPHKALAKFLDMSDQAYQHYLQELLGARLGEFTALGPRQHYPLKQMIAEKITLDHLILLGNTAHTLNPLGAQGFNLGLAGVKDAIETIKNHEALVKFSQRQETRCARLVQFTQQTQQMFGSKAGLTRLARRTALFALEHIPGMKKRFTRRMMGL